MPTNNGVRLDKDQGFSPICPKATQNDPKQLVRSRKPRLGTATRQESKPLPQGQVFKKEMTARTNRPDEQSEQEPQRTQHGWVIPKKHGGDPANEVGETRGFPNSLYC